MQARRYVAANIRCVSLRTFDDLPPMATDDELMVWSQELLARPSRPNRPLVATRTTSTVSTEEILLDIEERAAAAYTRRRVTVRR
jgi:hypothetical protein